MCDNIFRNTILASITRQMKILHTADWHLGKKLEQFNRIEEQKLVLSEICTIANEQDVDAVIIAGDLFDTYNPATEAEELFYSTIHKLSNHGKRLVIAIAGNHDSPDRINAPIPLARENGIVLVGYPNEEIKPFTLESGIVITKSSAGFIEVKLPKCSYPLRLILCPYANEYRLKKYLGHGEDSVKLHDLLSAHWSQIAAQYCDDQGVNLLVGHLFIAKQGEPLQSEPEDEKPILHVGGADAIFTKAIPPQIQYAAFGHLHRYQVVDEQPCPTIYSSSILGYSFSEAHQSKYVVLVDLEAGKKVVYEKIQLNAGLPLVRKKFDHVDDVVQWLQTHQDNYVELTIDLNEFLKSSDRRRIMRAHPRVVSIIPVHNFDAGDDQETVHIDLNQSMDQLFTQYFLHENGKLPNANIMDIFQELKALNK